MEKRVWFTDTPLAVALVLPQVLLVLLFFYWPSGAALYWAFTLEQPWGGGNSFVGLENFQTIFGDGQYWNSVVRSMVFALASTALAMAMGMLLALAVDRKLKGHQGFRWALIWPYAVAAPAAGLAFRFLLSPEAGLVAYLNHRYPGIWNPTVNGTQAMILIIVAYSWKYVAYNFLFMLAGLQSIPKSLIEAAAMDGSRPLRRIRDIQLPLMTPTIFFLLIVNLTDSFVDSFGIVDITTEGGPAKATDLLVYKIYFDGFRGLDYSGAAAQSIILMLLVIVLTFIQFRFVERRIHYG
ncbi:MAG TPA: ABC transporter permease subunit [Geminicoccus sp.]|jgi:sn-glycerol 3-phosphate transport system permease protein|uniref:ABC transporter permease subunit n=1 Tax=Geminicoccus sp. TaxID=2024832 RepID=UPI002E2FE69C|nr:ABC transporter permease subunit [Geminicoccus sp.]HEX2528621.1 ABC transporter permease subunit [Geminicoccus sp.]